MSNPNPVRRKPASDALSDRMKAKFPAYVPRQRQPNEAEPRVINTFASGANRYKPEPVQCARPGADQHFQFKSRGV